MIVYWVKKKTFYTFSGAKISNQQPEADNGCLLGEQYGSDGNTTHRPHVHKVLERDSKKKKKVNKSI